MNELALELVANYGVPVLFAVTFLSCLALPVPSSLLMLASGSFAATGDLSLAAVMAAAWSGAVLGDNVGYVIAKKIGDVVEAWLSTRPRRLATFNRARAFMEQRGGPAVFFSRWLVAPLGPYVNYVAGMTDMRWLRFALWGAAGEVVWVTLYVGIGYVLSDQITQVASLLSDFSGFLAALVVAYVLWRWLDHMSRERHVARAGNGTKDPHI